VTVAVEGAAGDADPQERSDEVQVDVAFAAWTPTAEERATEAG